MASLPLTPTSELEAVNVLLLAIGEQPVNTLSDSGNSDVSIAISVLHTTSRQVQSTGLHFNTEEQYRLPRDSNGYIQLPDNTLKVDASDPYEDYVMRGSRLYDRKNHTFVFDKTVEVDITFFLPFDELPQSARNYITVRAARIFQSRVLGSETLHAFTAQDEQQAYIELFGAELESADVNLLNNPAIAYGLRRY